MSRSGLSKEEAAKAYALLKHMESKTESLDFLQPVNFQALGLLDYPIIVKRPMDLSTVRKKVRQGKYSALRECVADVQLIWDNCRTYNMNESLIVQNANAMEKYMSEFLEQYRPEERPIEPVSEDSGEVTFEEKLDLSAQIRKVPTEVLSQFVKTVESDCPQAIDHLDKERIKIRVDLFSRATFARLQAMVAASVHEGEEEPGKRQKTGDS